MRATPASGLEVIRMLLALGFRVVRAAGSLVTLERGAQVVFVNRDGELSDAALSAILDAAHLGPSTVDRLLWRLRCRDTLPDIGGSFPTPTTNHLRE